VNRGPVEQRLPDVALPGAPSLPGYPPSRSEHPSVHAEVVAIMVCWSTAHGVSSP
jgi:hypothetical protein